MSERRQMPTMAELFAKYPPKKSEDIGEVHFDSEDEEEEADLISSLLPMERPFYDEGGNWIGDDEEAVEARREQLIDDAKKYGWKD